MYQLGWMRICYCNKHPQGPEPTKICFPLPLCGNFRCQQGLLFISHLGTRPEGATTVPNITSRCDRGNENSGGSCTGHLMPKVGPHSAHTSLARTRPMALVNPRGQEGPHSRALGQEGPGIAAKEPK